MEKYFQLKKNIITIKRINIKQFENSTNNNNSLNYTNIQTSFKKINFNSPNKLLGLLKRKNIEGNKLNIKTLYPKMIDIKQKMNKFLKSEKSFTSKYKVKNLFLSSNNLNNLNRSDDKLISHNYNKLENYLIGKIIGQGAQANVRLCKNKLTGNLYCMKIYKNVFIQNNKNKLLIEKEISILKEISHPNIIKFIDKIYSNSKIYLILEYAKGITLKSYMKNQPNQKLNELKAKKIFTQLISALSYLHNKNICHRDIKLDNIIINDNLNIKIIDLGLGIHFQENIKLNSFCGTPFFMAPEIYKKEFYYGPAVDIWSAGIVLYILLCGKLPFKSNNEKNLKQIICNGYIDFPNYLSFSVKDLIQKMLCINPGKRINCNQILKHLWMFNGFDLVE